MCPTIVAANLLECVEGPQRYQKALKKTQNRSTHILVIGGGVSALITAWILLDKGYRATIVSKERASLAKPLISLIAGALWEYPPVSGVGYAEFELYQLMADRDKLIGNGLERAAGAGKFGAKMKTLFHDANGGTDVNSGVLAVLVYPKKQFNVACTYQHAAPMIDTDVAMAFLTRLVQSNGAVLETREIIGDLRLHEQELLSEYHADIIVNTSGIGAHIPLRGAVKKIKRSEGYPADHAFLLPAQMNHDGSVSKMVFIVPRNDDTLVIGSITQRNNWQLNLSLDSPEVKAIGERATEFLPVLKDAENETRSLAQGWRPFSHLNVICQWMMATR
ncbi:hypothetical protein BDV38DRAFT_282226 [Aspergillus pseudotamarii]|uniref:FAD dependent oxidoreductase domain-containing protein n=1 Tax=Aspergillus pseudotamarii TaxID=132259 RepID=A0A5N6SWP7_ASPPS|nr:uncharacterized protein BDV38DRAFT_282226 [Aspergillus pseudotamarii]KAE8138219.1 hypothetical protein BDV38DRAFT_282226 [Aspergillus pseudotamarii]